MLAAAFALLVSLLGGVAQANEPAPPSAGEIRGESIPDDVGVAPGTDLDFPAQIAPDSTSSVQAAKAAKWYGGYAPPFKWKTYKWINRSYLGLKKSSMKAYYWYVPYFSTGQACSQGLGYLSSRKGTWRSLGCGKKGKGAVPWGRVVGIPKYKTTSQNLPLGAPTLWR